MAHEGTKITSFGASAGAADDILSGSRGANSIDTDGPIRPVRGGAEVGIFPTDHPNEDTTIIAPIQFGSERIRALTTQGSYQ